VNSSPAPLCRDAAVVRDALCLCLIPGVGPRTRRALLERFGSCAAVLAASVEQLQQVSGVGPRLSDRIGHADASDADREMRLCAQHQIDILLEQDAQYPAMLREIPDPPGVLFRRGDSRPADRLALAIVGTRHATRYGLRQAERLAAGLARAGLTIVSGLARGIDAAAHRGALEAGGRTIAVLGSGVLNVYPPEHAPLADAIGRQGMVLSELPPLQQPMSGTFPQRNRLITGLSLGVLVIEAAERSGALISATHAAEQGRDVFAMPGPVDSRMSRGCHRLIRDGAKLVETVDDVLEELGPLFAPLQRDDGHTLRHPAELQLNDQERQVLDAVATQPTDLDYIVGATHLPVPRVLATISVLEIRHLIRRIGGNCVVRL
jgi:DNA processing protein